MGKIKLLQMFVHKSDERTDFDDFRDSIERLNHRMKNQDDLFNVADDDLLIESLVYERKALELRHAYLMKKAREERTKYTS
ncbi:MAG: DUF2508 family protein [Oscillospiraceae bacterium]|jgi:hypothetical protein|nr:DUF2508 family protein [Oscillospiraceae bacterium]